MMRIMKNIKFEKVIVEWMDINSCDDAWNSEDQVKLLMPAPCTTIGYLYEDTPNYVKTFATFSYNSDDTLDIGDCVVIPKGCIVSLKKLEN